MSQHFTIPELRKCLKRLDLPTSGSRNDLLSRLNAADPEGTWMTSADESDNECQEAGASGMAVQQSGPSNDHERELEFVRRERDLLQREMELMRRENEILRSSPRSVQSYGSNVNMRVVGDMLRDFDGSTNTLSVWEKSLRLLRDTYELDEKSVKILIATKLKGKALEWLHSKPEHIEMSVEVLLASMKKMFDHRQSRLALRRKFEGRAWGIYENFSEYHHDKMILANQVGIDEEELIEYIIEGIPDDGLRSQARMHRFTGPSELLEAFENISLRPNVKRNIVGDRGIMPHRPSGNASAVNPPQPTRRCFNCYGEGHLASSCPKPKRERGSCFSCGEQGHGYQRCPKTSRTEATTSTSVSLVEKSSMTEEQRGCLPLQGPSRDCCVLLTEEKEVNYFVEALVDSGSAINLMTYKTFKNFFSEYELVQGKPNFNYGGVNQSPVSIMGYVNVRIKLQLLPNDIFDVRFMVVPDTTMTYSALLGRKFITRPGMTVILSKGVRIYYDREYRDEILSIEAIETKEKLNIVPENLDEAPPIEVKEISMKSLDNYVNLDNKVERVNRFLRSILAKLSAGESWLKALSKAQFTLNNTYHKAIGTEPSLLLFGYLQYGFSDDDIREYFRIYNETDEDRDKLREAAFLQNRRLQEYNKSVFDKKHKKPYVYKLGDYVMIKNVVTTPGINQKLLPKYKGPYVIDKVLRMDRYLIKDIEGFQLSAKPFSGVFSPDRMKLWIGDSECEVETNSQEEDLQ
ncbi:uncharacterized protein LOC122403828 [Colletes gigas]|uniref:uncharacterized protein LOC122403828 n=1 Tax=Colletes gigas TaxID=935657 RepID=UPI001C9AEA6D|nr:uncharacterized protein LOC122403828 [Colletes gigas]